MLNTWFFTCFWSEIWPRNTFEMSSEKSSCFKIEVVCSCVYTWGLEVDSSHLHRVCGVVRGDIGIVQQTFRPWLWLFTFTALEKERICKDSMKSDKRDRKITSTPNHKCTKWPPSVSYPIQINDSWLRMIHQSVWLIQLVPYTYTVYRY